MESSATSWAGKLGMTKNSGLEDKKTLAKKGGFKSGKKMEEMKKVASAGFVKAKAAAVVGAKQVKAGTVFGIKWVKEQYQKRKSSK